MKKFTMATYHGAEERTYIAEFELFGEMFVISHPLPGFFGNEKAWRASHKETGFAFGPSCKTWSETKKEAIAFLKSKGEEALKKAIRKAKRQIKKEGMKIG